MFNVKQNKEKNLNVCLLDTNVFQMLAIENIKDDQMRTCNPTTMKQIMSDNLSIK